MISMQMVLYLIMGGGALCCRASDYFRANRRNDGHDRTSGRASGRKRVASAR